MVARATPATSPRCPRRGAMSYSLLVRLVGRPVYPLAGPRSISARRSGTPRGTQGPGSHAGAGAPYGTGTATDVGRARVLVPNPAAATSATRWRWRGLSGSG